MNKAITLLVLIHSMSKAEKRYLKLYSNLQEGDKGYLTLFTQMEESASIDEVARRFNREVRGSSFDIAVKYLYKVVMECLTHLRSRDDIQSRISNRLSEAEILFRCGLLQPAVEQLLAAKKLAKKHGQSTLLLLIRQTELQYLSAGNFPDIREKQLVERQMKMNETLRHLRCATQHLQLYDILKYRSMHRDKVRSERDKQSLNDLVLSELHLIANNSYKGFEVDKLHQLFQSTYFLQSSNYMAAIRIYRQLLELFDQHPEQILDPPLYYLDAVLGILDSLLSARLYDEMPFFIARLQQLAAGNYSQDFIRRIQIHIYLYESFRLINSGSIAKAEVLYAANRETIFRKLAQQRLDQQLILLLNQVVLHMASQRLADARKTMARIREAGQVFYHFPEFRITRLIDLLLQAEYGHMDFVESEIKSIRRNSTIEIDSVERQIFQFVRLYPLPHSKRERNRLWVRIQERIKRISQAEYERPLLKFFDFAAWIESRLTDSDFIMISARNAGMHIGQEDQSCSF